MIRVDCAGLLHQHYMLFSFKSATTLESAIIAVVEIELFRLLHKDSELLPCTTNFGAIDNHIYMIDIPCNCGADCSHYDDV